MKVFSSYTNRWTTAHNFTYEQISVALLTAKIFICLKKPLAKIIYRINLAPARSVTKALATRSTSRGPCAHLVFTARVRHSKSSKITYPVKKRESTSGSLVPLSFITSTHPFSQGVLVTRLFCYSADSQNQMLQKMQIFTINLNKISFFHYTKRSFFLGIAEIPVTIEK